MFDLCCVYVNFSVILEGRWFSPVGHILTSYLLVATKVSTPPKRKCPLGFRVVQSGLKLKAKLALLKWRVGITRGGVRLTVFRPYKSLILHPESDTVCVPGCCHTEATVKDKRIMSKVQHDGRSVMFWGCRRAVGKDKLQFIERNWDHEFKQKATQKY